MIILNSSVPKFVHKNTNNKYLSLNSACGANIAAPIEARKNNWIANNIIAHFKHDNIP
jgi:hypothetical protein